MKYTLKSFLVEFANSGTVIFLLSLNIIFVILMCFATFIVTEALCDWWLNSTLSLATSLKLSNILSLPQ